MARIAIGDVQGCLQPLQELVKKIGFKADRDQLWFVGDLVNRGPDSLGVLRWVKSLGESARVVLGNHDLHLLAVAWGRSRAVRPGDTLEAVLTAPDRDSLLEWLLNQPLAVATRGAQDAPLHRDIMLHAGVPPQWSGDDLLRHAAEAHDALQRNPVDFFDIMYGNEPDRWSTDLAGAARWRFIINALTRMRYCDPEGRLDLRHKGAPGSQPPNLAPWFEIPERQSRTERIIFGHWSTLGLLQRPELLALDTGCVWGGWLTAVHLDDGRRWQVRGVPSK